MKNILIIGATSGIAQEYAKLAAKLGHSLFLVGRDEQKLKVITADLQVRFGVAPSFLVLDLDDLAKHRSMVEQAKQKLGSIDEVLIAHGILPVQPEISGNTAKIQQLFHTNFISVVSCINELLPGFKEQHAGKIAIITSVAGDRGRESNYIYGATKGALSAYLAGLGAQVINDGVHIIDIKPGFVDTPMTRNLKKGILFAQPEKVALDIYTAIECNKLICYTPGFWRWIMLIIRSIPEPIFRKLKL